MDVEILPEKKITFLISSLAGGGAEGVCVNIANGLADRGWVVTLVVLHMAKSVYHNRLSSKVNFVVLNVPNTRYSFFALYRYIKDNTPKKLVVFNYELPVVLILIRIFTSLNFYLITRNINTFSENKIQSKNVNWRVKIFSGLLTKYYTKADHIVNQCNGMKDDLLSVFPAIINKTSVIYNPVNEKLANIAKKTDFSSINKQQYLLCVGRLEAQKAFHYAIEAFALLTSKHPDLRLKIVGKGSLENDLKQLVEQLNIKDKVDFEGFQDDVATYYLRARVTLLTSLYEGFPNTLLESITLGTPIVAFDCKSGPKEIIKQGVNGVLVEYQNTTAFVDAIDLSLKKPFDSEKTAATATKYQAENIINQWCKLLS
jgi:glycosyltransferase involved in cell wall biosynthesis